MKVIICPGSSSVTAEAADLFGGSRVITGGFREPIYVTSLTEEEATFCRDYFESQGKKVTVEA